jgi:hypothetical protein
VLGRDFHGLQDDGDPIVAQYREACERTMSIPTHLGPMHLPRMKDFVTVRGGGYFFMPGARGELSQAFVEPRPDARSTARACEAAIEAVAPHRQSARAAQLRGDLSVRLSERGHLLIGLAGLGFINARQHRIIDLEPS